LASSSARRGRGSAPRRRTSRTKAPATREKRLRILFLTFQFPFPADSGGTIKTLSILDYLRGRHNVRLVCFRRGELTKPQADWARSFGDVLHTQHNRSRSALNLVRSYVSKVPLSIERNRSAAMQKLVADSVKGWSPEVIFVDSWLMAQYLPPDYEGLKLLHEHNAEFELWDRQADLESGPRRSVATREAQRVRKYEQETLARFDGVFAVSEDDRHSLAALGADIGRIHVLPNIPDRALLDLPNPNFEDTEPIILYLGTLSWQPNIEGVERFLSSVLPSVHKRAPDARLVVAGRGASKALAQKVRAAPGAVFLGEIDDTESLYATARVFVDATQSGGGTRLKVLNALARGVPVVASQYAAQGLDIVPGEHLIVARGPDQMADAVVHLLSNAVRWKVLSQNGRALVRARFVAETAFRGLDSVLKGASDS
jgi:glycosyltransferase involved in cell wall biosynthesis